MKAYHLTHFGTLDGLIVCDQEIPVLGPREALVRISAASLNRRDLMILNRTYPVPARPDVVPVSDGALFALQIAKALGARVIATTSSDEKAERLKHLGADDVVNYQAIPDWSRTVRELTAGVGVNRVVGTGGSDTLEESIKSVAPNGELALVTAIGKRPMIEIHPPVLAASLLTIRRLLVGSRTTFEDMLHTIANSELHPVIDRVFPFAEAEQAYHYYTTASPFGKVVISLN